MASIPEQLPPSSDKKMMILDCDTGVDDAHAILMAVSNPNVHLLAITCVQGNVGVDQVCYNVARTLEACRKDGFQEQIPIYKGARHSLLNQPVTNHNFHGSDGLGDAPDETKLEFKVEEEIAATALVRLARQYPQQITLVATGPLTNLALAARLDHEFPQLLNNVVIMGGNIYGKGNTTPSAEFNFHVDPEAAFIVLTDFNCKIYVISWELTLEQAVDIDWFKSLLEAKNKRGEFMKQIHDHSLVKLLSPETITTDGVRDWIPCDASAMAVALDKNVIKSYKTCPCTVELAGHVSRGQMVVDWNSLSNQSQTNYGCPDWIACDPVAMAVAIDNSVIKASKKCACSVELAGVTTRGQLIVDWNNLTKKPQTVIVITDLQHKQLKDLLWTAIE